MREIPTPIANVPTLPMPSSPPRGILIVDKPLGPSSHAVVAAARKALGTRKVGHAGTLDPAASGVLVLGVGAGTRLLGYLAGDDKEYVSTFVMGIGTVSDDAQGEVTASPGAVIDRESLAAAMTRWTGNIAQRPSSVSAIKVDGRRAYDLVRSGEDVELPARPVCISAFELLEMAQDVQDGVPVTVVRVRVVGSAGTYVRALARDVAMDLGTVGHVRELRRVRSGAFVEADSVVSESITPEAMLTLVEAARRSMTWVEVPTSCVDLIGHGVRIPWPEDAPRSGDVALVNDERLLAVARCRDSQAAYAAVFTDER